MTSETTSTEEHFRLVDHDGKWSVYKDDASGASQPVLVDMSGNIARMVLAELQGLEPAVTDETVTVMPAVTVPAGYPDKVRGFLGEIIELNRTVVDLTDRIGAEVLTPGFEVWNLSDLPDEVRERFSEVTGWDLLDKNVRHLAGLLLASVGDTDADLLDEDKPSWFLALELRQLRRDQQVNPVGRLYERIIPRFEAELARRDVEASELEAFRAEADAMAADITGAT